MAKGYNAEDIVGELSLLIEQGVLNDERFAEAYAYHRAQKGFGPNRLRAELGERGVDDAVVEATLAAADFDWRTIIKSTWQKKFRNAPANFQEKAKQSRFLEYRGFTGNAISHLFAELGNNVED